MQLLRNVDADEVSPVKRGANRKRVILKADGEAQMENEIADIMAVPWESEGSMIDTLRKEGADESVVKAAVGAMRLLAGIGDDLPDGMREAVEKLGSEMYARSNPKLNTTGVPSPGGLTGDGDGAAKDGSAGKQTDLDGDGTDGQLSGTGFGKKVAADDEDCDDPLMKAKKKRAVAKEGPVAEAFRVIKNALGITTSETVETTANEDPADVPATDEVEKGGTVETHAVPIQKEDGSWDLSGVPDGSRPFYEAMIAKAAEADETRVKLEKAEEALEETRDQLRTNEIIAKAETEFKKVGAVDDLVEVLKSASATMSPEAYEKLVTLLSAANARIEKGDLFTEMGRTVAQDGSGTDAWAKIEKAADALVEKSDAGMTREKAIDRVLQTAEGAELYSAYMRQTGLGVN